MLKVELTIIKMLCMRSLIAKFYIGVSSNTTVLTKTKCIIILPSPFQIHSKQEGVVVILAPGSWTIDTWTGWLSIILKNSALLSFYFYLRRTTELTGTKLSFHRFSSSL